MSEYIEHDPETPGVGLVERRFFTFADPAAGEEPFVLESKANLGPVTVAYETYGKLAGDRNNAVLVAHALTGDAHVAGFHSEDYGDPHAEGGPKGLRPGAKPGWWDIMVGPGKPIDTDQYFVICANVLGGCGGSTGPASPNPADPDDKPYGRRFPVVTVGDMVRVQRRLLDHLGVDKLLSVVGGSVGGMQVLEWAVRYPERVRTAIPLATTTRHSALNIAFHEVARQAIMADPKWQNGDYYGDEPPALGLAVGRMIGHITYLSDEAMRQKFGRRLQERDAFTFDLDAAPDFQVESYLRHQGKKFVERFDANSFLYVTKAADYFDLAEQHGDGSLVRALSGATARFLLVSFSSDWLYPTASSRETVRALKKNGREVSFCEINADCGHDAFLLRNERLNGLVREFLRHATEDVELRRL